MVTVIDYGMGNLRSVSKALEHLGANVCVSGKPEDVAKADRVILPGVGAFGDAISELKSRNLIDSIGAHIAEEKPFLGICLGLQLLFTESQEAPGTEGLGVIEGAVKRFESADVKIPHMGWNSVETKDHPLLKNVETNSFFYFVHTFYAVPSSDENTLGSCQYGQETFSAIVGKGNTFATQFHPEKSQKPGLQILENFLKI